MAARSRSAQGRFPARPQERRGRLVGAECRGGRMPGCGNAPRRPRDVLPGHTDGKPVLDHGCSRSGFRARAILCPLGMASRAWSASPWSAPRHWPDFSGFQPIHGHGHGIPDVQQDQARHRTVARARASARAVLHTQGADHQEGRGDLLLEAGQFRQCPAPDGGLGQDALHQPCGIILGGHPGFAGSRPGPPVRPAGRPPSCSDGSGRPWRRGPGPVPGPAWLCSPRRWAGAAPATSRPC